MTPQGEIWPVARVRAALLTSVAALVVCAGVAWQRPGIIWQAYLVGFLAWWFVTVGAAALFAVGHVTGGAWMQASRPALLAAMALAPLLAISFLPVALNLSVIYPWAEPSSPVRADFGHAKASYLSPRFFLIRSAICLAASCGVAWLLARRPFLRPRPADTPAVRRGAAFSLVFLLFAATMAAFDWAMSLEPSWYSSIYGAMLTVEGALAAHAAATLGYCASATRLPQRALELVAPAEGGEAASDAGTAPEDVVEALHDMGKLLLAYIILAAYLAFSQLLIIWSGNLPSEISWYLRRTTGGWLAFGGTIYALHLAAPFIILLSRDVKRSPRPLARVAALVMFTYFGVMIWIIAPSFPVGMAWSATASTAAVVAVGGAWAAVFMWQSNVGLRSLVQQEPPR